MGALANKIDRRRFLGAAAAGAGGALLSRRLPRASAAGAEKRLGHLAWLWRFEDDGEPAEIRAMLARHGLGIIVKTHDGADWMGRWQEVPTPILGGAQVQWLASYFESQGVPFHAWCVVDGRDPITEARMCAEVLSSGARSLTLDLEPDDDGQYWQAGPEEAIAFGLELRRLQPTAWLSVAPDPRPWQVDAVPMAEFAGFCNEIAPQTYWQTFDTPANYRLLVEHGFIVGLEGVTPQLILDVSQKTFRRFRLPIRPIGQGAADREGWQTFVSHAYSLGMDAVSVWRYGTAQPDIWPLLQELRPKQPAPPRSASPSPTPVPQTPFKRQTSTQTIERSRQRDDDEGSGGEQPKSSAQSKSEKPDDETDQPSEPRTTKSFFSELFSSSDSRDSRWPWPGGTANR